MNESSQQTRTTVTAWLSSLNGAGYRLTRPRRAVVEVVAASPFALTPQEVYDRARQEKLKIGLTTVYRTLEALVAAGLVVRVHQESDCQAYAPAARGHRHLLICEQCGRTSTFSGDQLEGLIARVEEESGFQIRDHWLQLTGACTVCQAADGPQPAAGRDDGSPA